MKKNAISFRMSARMKKGTIELFLNNPFARFLLFISLWGFLRDFKAFERVIDDTNYRVEYNVKSFFAE